MIGLILLIFSVVIIAGILYLLVGPIITGIIILLAILINAFTLKKVDS